MDPSPKSLEDGAVKRSPDGGGGDDDWDEKSFTYSVNSVRPEETHRGLSSRALQFLALGGCIGTGLFVGSGATLSTVGPGKLIVSTHPVRLHLG